MELKKEEKNNNLQALDTKNIDILEQNINEISPSLLKILLKDKTTGKYIYWACDEYVKYGKAYTASKEILPKLIINKRIRIIQPRITKIKVDQQNRTKKSAEVFTPSWICNEMINHCDEQWFGRPNVFNTQNNHDWTPTKEKIQFKEYKNNKKSAWMYYVDTKRLEITCGEGPYLTSRYDTTTGTFLPIEKRIGILDRKLRIVNENTNNEEEWFKWAKRAYEATYGYEYQGDNLLLARENLLFTFIDNFKFKHKKEPEIKKIKQIANIIAWNIWQMDGLTNEIPNIIEINKGKQLELFNDLPKKSFTTKVNEEKQLNIGQQLELFEILPQKNLEPIFCKIKNWRSKRIYNFKNFKGENMKFDVVIGNPPYQVSDGGAKASAKPIYHFFMQQAKKITNRYISLIMPARFFTGGKGLDDFRDEMIHDRRFKILHDYADSKKCFSNVDVKGGICHFIWDKKYNDKCDIYRINNSRISYSKRFLVEDNDDIFIREEILVFIKNKVQSLNEETFDSIISAVVPYGFISDFFKDPSKYGLPPISEIPINNGYKILGLDSKLKRIYRYIPKNYPFTNNEGINKFKIFISESYGCGGIEDTPAIPVLAIPGELCTGTFIQIGPFEIESEMKNCFYYIKTKFFRALVGIRKQTQHAPKSVYKFVPLQDFTTNSDIDWAKTIPEIDQQLYKKYNLNQEEIDFIESRIKPME